MHMILYHNYCIAMYYKRDTVKRIPFKKNKIKLILKLFLNLNFKSQRKSSVEGEKKMEK